MIIKLNGEKINCSSKSLLELKKELGFSDESICIINGFEENNSVISEGDSIFIFDKGSVSADSLSEELIYARHTPNIREKLKNATVGIAGLGGLGSNIAVNLARTGVGRLIIADFDIVEPTNLNRQQYRISHLGLSKAMAMKSQLGEINPFTKVSSHQVKIDEKNAIDIFGECQIVCEAFDTAECKAMLVNTILCESENISVVAASGLAGLDSCTKITTRRINDRLIICGDGVSEASQGMGLMAMGAAVCAGHQANAAVKLILEGNFDNE